MSNKMNGKRSERINSVQGKECIGNLKGNADVEAVKSLNS